MPAGELEVDLEVTSCVGPAQRVQLSIALETYSKLLSIWPFHIMNL